MFCTNCGATLGDLDKFCAGCGQAAAGVVPPSPAASAWHSPPPQPQNIDVRVSGAVDTTTRAPAMVGLLKGIGALATVGGMLLAVAGWTLRNAENLAAGAVVFLVGLALFVAGRVMQ